MCLIIFNRFFISAVQSLKKNRLRPTIEKQNEEETENKQEKTWSKNLSIQFIKQ